MLNVWRNKNVEVSPFSLSDIAKSTVLTGLFTKGKILKNAIAKNDFVADIRKLTNLNEDLIRGFLKSTEFTLVFIKEYAAKTGKLPGI